MNNTFNIQRFGLLLKRQWLEFGKIYLITLVVVFGVTVAFYGFNIFPLERFRGPHDLGFREPLFVIFGFLFITIIASSYFAHLGQKPKAIIDLMIPASTFEKFLGAIIFTSLMSTISFLLIFYITDLAFISYLKSNLTEVGAKEILFITEKEFISDFRELRFVYMLPLFVTSVFLLGSIYFNRFHYIKTAISVMIFSGIWTYIIYNSGRFLFDNKILIHNEDGRLGWLERSYIEMYMILLLALLTYIFWAITYVRLKEKQV